MRRFLVLLALAIGFFPIAVSADSTQDAKLNVYARLVDANVRIDKIESVRHIDGNPIVSDMDPDEDNGYVIVSVSVQNPGTTEIFMPAFSTTLFLEDQSKVESNEVRGPYVGTKTTAAPDRLAPKESLRLRYVITHWPGTRVTKLVIESNLPTAPSLRYQIGPADITTLAEIPRPKPTD